MKLQDYLQLFYNLSWPKVFLYLKNIGRKRYFEQKSYIWGNHLFILVVYFNPGFIYFPTSESHLKPILSQLLTFHLVSTSEMIVANQSTRFNGMMLYIHFASTESVGCAHIYKAKQNQTMFVVNSLVLEHSNCKSSSRINFSLVV